MSSQDTHNKGVVFDIGSQNTKAGFAGEAFPRSIFPSVVGRFRRQGLSDGFPEIYCGHEAILKRGLSMLTWPVQEGFIKNWDEMEKLWHFLFYEALQVPPEECGILHAVHPLVPKGDREKMAEILFESFAIQSLSLMKTPSLVLHASGRTSGVVWENGFSSSYVAPVYEGFPLKHTTICSPVTGEALTDRLYKLMTVLGYSFTTPMEKDLLDKIKGDICYVATDYDTEMNRATQSEEVQLSYTLPDGQKIIVGKERFQCPEVLFQPSLQDFKCPSIVENIITSIDKCDEDYRPLFYGNLVISGGSSMFPGLVTRLISELNRAKRMPGSKFAIDEVMNSRKCTAWSGGSILASIKGYRGFWMTKDEYEDIGPDRVNYKFF